MDWQILLESGIACKEAKCCMGGCLFLVWVPARHRAKHRNRAEVESALLQQQHSVN